MEATFCTVFDLPIIVVQLSIKNICHWISSSLSSKAYKNKITFCCCWKFWIFSKKAWNFYQKNVKQRFYRLFIQLAWAVHSAGYVMIADKMLAFYKRAKNTWFCVFLRFLFLEEKKVFIILHVLYSNKI